MTTLIDPNYDRARRIFADAEAAEAAICAPPLNRLSANTGSLLKNCGKLPLFLRSVIWVTGSAADRSPTSLANY